MAEEAKILYQQEFLDRLLNPEYNDSIYGNLESGKLHLLLYESVNSPPREHVLNGITPFMTLNDIKLAIYIAMDSKEIALPDYTFIAVPSPVPKRFTPFEYGWSDPAGEGKPFLLMNPFNLIKGKKPDVRFIEPSGARRILRMQGRERMKFESSFLRIPFYYIIIKI